MDETRTASPAVMSAVVHWHEMGCFCSTLQSSPGVNVHNYIHTPYLAESAHLAGCGRRTWRLPATCLMANGLIAPADAPSQQIRRPCTRQCRGVLQSVALAS